MKYILLILSLASACSPMALAAVQAPGSDIWLAELATVDGQLAAGKPRNLTDRTGYDNQPVFVSNEALLFTSMDDDGQTDIWRLDLASNDAQVMLETPQSEYSPTPAPAGALSVVRVALDDVQQLWMLPAGGNSYELLFPTLEGIGYHAWVNDDHVALFIIPEASDAPVELHIANHRTGEVLVLAKGIGRSLHGLPGERGSVAFIEPDQEGKPWIKRFDLENRRITRLAPVLGDSEDFAFLPDGRIVMARNRSVFVHADGQWLRVAEFSNLPGKISRLAASPDGRKLAMVIDEDG